MNSNRHNTTTIKGQTIALVVIIVLFFQPLFASAQEHSTTNTTTTGSTGTSTSSTSQLTPQQQQNLSASAQVRQRFDPTVTLGNGSRTFSGISFTGVFGAIAGCTNVGGSIVSGISSISSSLSGLFSSKPGSLPGDQHAGSSTTSGGGAHDSAAPPPPLQSKGSAAQGISDALGESGLNADNQNVPTTDKTTQDQLKQINQREACLNGVAYAIEKNLLQQVIQKMLTFVNTGMNGNPLYVRDIDSYLKTVSDQRISIFLDNVLSDNPIFGNAIRSIVTENVTGLSDGLINKVMDTPEAKAYQNFQNDFNNGGWEAFLNPRNSPIDAIFNAADNLSRDISTEQQNVKDQLQRNSGYLDVQKCVQYASVDTQQTLDQQCLKWETVTPGSVIAAQVAAISTTQIHQLEQADQINEVVGSFFDNLVNNLISQGLSSLGNKRGSGFRYGGTGLNVVLGANGQPISSVASGEDALGYSASSGSNVLPSDFDVSHPKDIRAVLQAQYNYLNRVLDARTALNKIVPTLGALDYCIPGPNPTWADGLADNANTFFGSLQVVQKDSTLAQRIFSFLGGLLGNLLGSNDPHAVAASGTALFDKVTNGPQVLSDIVLQRPGHSPENIVGLTENAYNDLLTTYQQTYTQANIENAFMSVDPTNQAYAKGFVDSAFEETAKLPQYAQGAIAIDRSYSQIENDMYDSINELESIRAEADDIVATAKARYIAEKAAAGTPVNVSCLDSVYGIDDSPIVPVARQESDGQSPLFNQFIEANNYFYSNL
ncbi:MAG TPA: hypothetical protein VG982_02035 [Candidatus Paceibacterota bacterium]|nr:hypothetical protein [Candidatus Paceibacterota bacterium]